MGLPSLVVDRRPALNDLGKSCRIKRNGGVMREYFFRQTERKPAVSIGHRNQSRSCIVRHRKTPAYKAFGPRQQLFYRRSVEPVQREHLRPRQERRVQFK